MITHRASSKMSICQRLFWVDSYRATAGCNKFSLLSLLNQLSRSKYFFKKKYFKAFILHKSQHLPKVKSRILIINFVFYSSLSLSLSLSHTHPCMHAHIGPHGQSIYIMPKRKLKRYTPTIIVVSLIIIVTTTTTSLSLKKTSIPQCNI